MKILKTLLSWQWLPVTTFLAIWAMTLVFRTADPATVVLSYLYPPKDSIGGVSLPLRRIAPSPQTPAGDDGGSLLLIQHENDRDAKVTLLAVDPTPAQALTAGANVQPLPRMVPVTERAAGSSRILEVELPPRALFAVLVTDTGQQPDAARTRFSFTDDTLHKTFARTNDLVINTQNEIKGLRVFYLCVVVFAACIGLALGRMPRLTFPPERPGLTRGQAGGGGG
jgi:hypothetical protein